MASQDIVKLKPKQWLNDEVINFYGIMVLGRADKAEAARKEAKAAGIKPERSLNSYWRVHYFSSFFYSRLIDQGYSGVRRWSKKVSLGEGIMSLCVPSFKLTPSSSRFDI